MKHTFDYETLHECDYLVDNPGNPEGVSDCRQPATHKVWWHYENGVTEEWYLCRRHFRKVREQEGV